MVASFFSRKKKSENDVSADVGAQQSDLSISEQFSDAAGVERAGVEWVEESESMGSADSQGQVIPPSSLDDSSVTWASELPGIAFSHSQDTISAAFSSHLGTPLTGSMSSRNDAPLTSSPHSDATFSTSPAAPSSAGTASSHSFLPIRGKLSPQMEGIPATTYPEGVGVNMDSQGHTEMNPLDTHADVENHANERGSASPESQRDYERLPDHTHSAPQTVTPIYANPSDQATQPATDQHSVAKEAAALLGTSNDGSQRPSSGNSTPPETARVETTLTPKLSPQERFHRSLEQWKKDLTAHASGKNADNLPRYTLANAHPGGLAQLYALHPTRLSNLVREPNSYSRILTSTRRIMVRQAELSAQHGLAPTHFALGYATWTHQGSRHNSPALMRTLSFQEDGNDIVLTLGKDIHVAPALLSAASSYGIDLDEAELALESGITAKSFSSSRAFNFLREACRQIPDFQLRDDLSMGIYEHPAATLLRELDDHAFLSKSSIVRALGGDSTHTDFTLKPFSNTNPFDRDPWSERGIGSLAPEHHNVIEAVLAERSLVVQGQEDINNQLLASILTEVAVKGRSVVHVAGGRSRLARLESSLSEAGVGQLVVRIDGSADDCQRLQDSLSHASEQGMAPIDDSEYVEQIRNELLHTRDVLSAYTRQLHAPFQHFGVSAMDALQVLTDITSRKPAPRTKIRLRSDVLFDIAKDQGETARSLLHRAEELGMFSRSAAHSAWKGVVITAPEQVDIVMSALVRLSRETLPAMREDIARVTHEAQLAPAGNMRHWQAEIDMLHNVRDALDIFKPEIFEHSAADMVIATAPAQWRKERGIDMKRSQRSRLIKHAQDLLLPGKHVTDLHRELVLVQEKREVWRHYSNADSWPVLPRGLQKSVELTQRVQADLELISPALATGFPDIFTMPFGELQRLVDRLAGDPAGADLLPQRVALLKEASELGLDQLLTDLRRRHVEGEKIDAELDLAWWASFLGLILASDPAFRGMDPHMLTVLLEHCQVLDEQHTATLLPQALDSIQRRRIQAMSTRPEQYDTLQRFIEHGKEDPCRVYSQHSLASSLVPTVLTLPTLVPTLVPRGREIDLLILDDVSLLPVAELVPLIARARQVLVISHQSASGSTAELASVLPVAQLAPRPSRLNDQVARLLSYYGVPHMSIPQPWAMSTEPMTGVWVETSGMPAPGATTIESTAVEVDAVIDVIIDHVLNSPGRSLAVIALNATHADRIREAVARAIAQEPALRSFFDPEKAEPFVVADPSQVGGVQRDHIVISVGFAKNPHGRVLHDFGVFSTAAGDEVMSTLLACVREDLTLVSGIRPGEVDRTRCSTMGVHMLLDLLATAEGQVPIAPGSWPVLESQPDRLLIDLADRLYSMGLEVIPNVGVEGGIRIPLAIGHPSVPDRLLVAVLTDDADYVSEPSLRVRDRLVPQMLRDQGWRVFTALSLAVFIDPAAVAQQIVDVVLDEVERATLPDDVPTLSEESQPVIAELAPAEQAALDATNDARARHDEAMTGMIQIISAEDSRDSSPAGTSPSPGAGSPVSAAEKAVHEWNASVEDVAPSAQPRLPRPPIARGLPLSAYGDDQLDELALWIRSDGIERSQAELVEELRQALRLTRRGTQTDAVLANVIRRTAHLPVQRADEKASGSVSSLGSQTSPEDA